ncbi:MAG: FIST C-terminal domain-containing protein, partial [Candidatus Omnitrophica bacterium]|nr:FIST C-terminal domain-containing protein [Candidatus Omnitrophota bacterium]MBU1996769.1 FIST C-terminal domain-containing protein [Candidatus Omnitrophota bacterium]
MKLEQICWKNAEKGWEVIKSELDPSDQVQLVIAFGHPDLCKSAEHYDSLKSRYPDAQIVGGSTAGNVLGTSLSDNDIVATAVHLEKSHIKVISENIKDPSNLQQAASDMVKQLDKPDLKHIFVLSDGIHFNGSELAKGLNTLSDVASTGGLVGDQANFKNTYVIANNPGQENLVVMVGFYGKNLHTGHGCLAGWGEFGIDRVITKSTGNIVYEIDNQPALELYKKYLGEFAEQLPASGLRFPLSIRQDENRTLIRTLLSVNKEEQSLTFAGDVPEGSITLLMKGNVDDLIKSAGEAAKQARYSDEKRGLAIIISCVGR